MATIPRRIAQTSTEVKKQHKKSGPALPARQLKQLERGLELDQRATRLRDAEEKRKAAKKKRAEREAKEERARQQTGVGLATQMIGYSHTQAQLKNGMEAFLGVKKRRDDEKWKKETEIAQKLEAIEQALEKEPWDDDDEADGLAFDIIETNASIRQQWVDDDVDDDSLLQAHDLVMSDPIEEVIATAETASRPAPLTTHASPPRVNTENDCNFSRIHGPINKIVEATLNGLPGELIELLSQDISLKQSEWDPSPGLLHKLNPVGLPPHRLRIKVGCAVTLLRDLNTSSQLSRSQHLRVLRAENERLECIVMDGQLEGTKTILTRVPFLAKYKNQDQFPFRRTQFPIRIATDYQLAGNPRDTTQSGFKLPAIPGRVLTPNLCKQIAPPILRGKPQANQNPGYKMPSLPASKLASSRLAAPTPAVKYMTTVAIPHLDAWDDFLESGTQIARELSAEVPQHVVRPFRAISSATTLQADFLPPVSTQDLDFTMDDLEDERTPIGRTPPTVSVTETVETKEPLKLSTKPPAKDEPSHTAGVTPVLNQKISFPITEKFLRTGNTKHPSKPKAQKGNALTIDLTNLRPSQKPLSVSDRPGLKRRALRNSISPSKRQCASSPRPALPIKPMTPVQSCTVGDELSLSNETFLSTQDVASFFDDEMFEEW